MMSTSITSGRMRNWVVIFTAIAAVLAGIAAGQLYGAARFTAEYFAWTVNPPISAAFIGAHFLAVVIMAVAAVREKMLSQARYFLPTVLMFAVAMLVATLFHVDKFHFLASSSLARGAAWAWLVVYVAVPVVALLAIWQEQVWRPAARMAGAALPGFVRGGLLLYGLVFLLLGMLFLFFPKPFVAWWPWAVTPLIVRASAAMIVALGVTALTLARENNVMITSAPLKAFGVLAVLHGVSLLRFYDQVVFGSELVAYVMVLMSMVVFSIVSLGRLSRK
jgi:hypothetical protein